MFRVTSVFTLLISLIAANSTFGQTATFDQRASAGRELFVHQWQPNDPLAPSGDGLGPMFNANSCLECHSQGGIGGSGANKNNVEIMAVLPDPGEPSRRSEKAFVSRLRNLHPMFVDADDHYYLGVLLHRNSTTPGYDAYYQDWTKPLKLDGDSRARIRRMLARRHMSFVSQLPLQLVEAKKGMQFAIAQRNPPQLFGLDLIDRHIKETDLQAIAESQRGSPSGVSGRFTGRYGWRGQMDDLDFFIKGACAAELGLQVEEMAQAPDPTRMDYKLESTDLDSTQTNNLVAFVRSLPRPEMVVPEDPNERSYVTQGKLLFSQVGCAECHVEKVGTLKGVYSDFLLHDMGPDFEDPIPAKPIPSYTVIAGLDNMFVDTGGEARYEDEKAQLNQSKDRLATRIEKIKSGEMPPYYGLEPQWTPSQIEKMENDLAGMKTRLPNPNDPKFQEISSSVTELIRFQSIEEKNHYKEYRTPALWGVADSAPYLHDGRADTLRAAIEWHGGEGYASMMRFSELSEEQQTSVLKFLEALKAPQAAEKVPDQIAGEKKHDAPVGDKFSALRSGSGQEVVAGR